MQAADGSPAYDRYWQWEWQEPKPKPGELAYLERGAKAPGLWAMFPLYHHPSHGDAYPS